MRRAQIERSAGDVPEEHGDKDDEQVAVRHADASGGHIIENQPTRRGREHPGKRCCESIEQATFDDT